MAADVKQNGAKGAVQLQDLDGENYSVDDVMSKRQSGTQDTGKIDKTNIFPSQRKPNWKKTWLESLRVFAGQVSVVGLRYVANASASSCRRSVWLILILVGAGFTTYQIQDRIVRFANFPVNVIIHVDHMKEMRFPTVTICNENRVSLQRANALG